jgi:hypothetical protein
MSNLHGEHESLFWRLVAPRDLRHSLREVRHGHRYAPLRLRRVLTTDLRARREPLLIPLQAGDIDRVYSAPHLRAENPIERFFPVVNGVRDRRICHMPHVALMREYGRTGKIPADSDYAQLLRVRARLQGRRRDSAFVDRKVRSLLRVYDSIKRRGYRRGIYWRQVVSVFEFPLMPARPAYRPQNWEVFDGHHRAAALAALNVPEVNVLVVRAIPVTPYDWREDLRWQEEWWNSDCDREALVRLAGLAAQRT